LQAISSYQVALTPKDRASLGLKNLRCPLRHTFNANYLK